MKSLYINIIVFAGLFLQISACQPDASLDFKDALTFYVSFDNGTTADFALGDTRIYTANATYANSRRSLEGVQEGMNNAAHRIIEGEGQFGHAFEFGEKSNSVIFYNSKGNVRVQPKKLVWHHLVLATS